VVGWVYIKDRKKGLTPSKHPNTTTNSSLVEKKILTQYYENILFAGSKFFTGGFSNYCWCLFLLSINFFFSPRNVCLTAVVHNLKWFFLSWKLLNSFKAVTITFEVC